MKKEIIKNNSDEIKIGKNQVKTIGIILTTVIITLLIIGVTFVYAPKIIKNYKIDSYKKEAYTSVLCQYSCPLESQEFQNKTQMMPGKECVKQCAQKLQSDKAKYTGLTNNDLSKDNLIKDISTSVDSCRTSSLINGTIILDNERYFPCVVQDLESLKGKYSYLK